MLDSAGLHDVQIEQIPGELTDHYDSRPEGAAAQSRGLQSSSLAAVGIAAHEAGHALQDAQHTPR